MNRIISSRITEAREARALSMEDLAESVGVTRQSISKYERGIISPSMEILQAISCKLSIPIDFFYKDEVRTKAGNSPLFFRSKAKIPKKVKVACKYQVKWADEVKKLLENYVNFVAIQIPTIDSDYTDLSSSDIEELALQIRKDWGLGSAPIKDLIGILENKGVIVSKFSVNDNCPFKGIDAFSSWRDGTPFILYHPIQKSAVRTRFSILHELGHLIMHSSIAEEDSIKKDVVDLADTQADRFAAAFLLPATSFPNDIHGTSLAALEIIKRKWGVSFSTIIKRCEDLNLFSDNQINYLRRQMTTKKYWYKEPLDDVLSMREPEMLRDAVLLLINNDIINQDTFLSESALSDKDLKNICNLPDSFFKKHDNRQKPILKIVK